MTETIKEIIKPKPCQECHKSPYDCFKCEHKLARDRAEKQYQNQFYRNHPSKYNIDYTKRIKNGSSDTIGTYKNAILKATIKRGYYHGGLPVRDWSNPRCQRILIDIEFKDGCTTGMSVDELNPGWQKQVESLMDKLEQATPELEEHLTARELLTEEIIPLQEKASQHAQKMFEIIDEIKP